jgi:hypothetical protein
MVYPNRRNGCCKLLDASDSCHRIAWLGHCRLEPLLQASAVCE